MYNLGLRYEKGRGVPENKAKAIELYREAAAKENSNAIARLGLCYELGIGLEKNVDGSVRLWHQAGELKNSFAMCKLGSCYETGLGVKKDVVKAAEWYEKAAQKGDVEAMYKLGLCYANGVGVLKDDAKAIIWRNRALERGFKYPNVDLRTYSQVIDDIFSLMKNPSNKSIMDKIKNYYEKVDLKLKLLIVKHLIFLKNMGHQDAINALNELRPDIKQNCCPVECIVDGELDPEKIEKLFAEKKSLDLEYAKYIDDLSESSSGKEENNVCERKLEDCFVISSSLVRNKDLLFSPKFLIKRIWRHWKHCSVVSEGWKIHVSAQPSSALKIAKIAVPILQKYDVPFKICESLDALRVLNLTPIYPNLSETQAGKFIAIYPETDDDSAKLVKELDEAFAQAIDARKLHLIFVNLLVMR